MDISGCLGSKVSHWQILDWVLGVVKKGRVLGRSRLQLASSP